MGMVTIPRNERKQRKSSLRNRSQSWPKTFKSITSSGYRRMESKVDEDDVEIHDPPSFSFDFVIGCIEDAVVSEEFETVQHNFLSEHCNLFDNCEENQLFHTDIFNTYVDSNFRGIPQRENLD